MSENKPLRILSPHEADIVADVIQRIAERNAAREKQFGSRVTRDMGPADGRTGRRTAAPYVTKGGRR